MKNIFFAVTLLCTLLLCACSQTQTPEEVVSSYISLLYQGKTEKAYQYISKNDQAQIGIFYFKESHFPYNAPLFRPFYAKAEFSIKKVTADSKTATVITEQDVLDYKTVYRLCSRSINGKTQFKNHKERHEALADSLGNKNPFIKTEVTYRLINENGHWKIRFSPK